MSLVWCNGAVHTSDVQPISTRNRGLTLGDGLFETVLVAGGVALWFREHLQRLERSGRVFGITIPRDEISTALAALVQQGGAGLHVLRITVTRGDTRRGLAGDAGPTQLFMTLDHFAPALIGQDVTLFTSTVRRSPSSISSTHKALSYIDAIIAAREAEAQGCGDALMLNVAGNAASSTIANIFMVQDNRLITPALDQGILPGVMRQEVLQCAVKMNFITEERVIAPNELFGADSVFLCNSLRLVRPVTAIDGKALALGKTSVILDQLCQTIKENCGTDPRQF